jgi:hypothetical protein
MFVNSFKFMVMAGAITAMPLPASTQQTPPVAVSSGVSYQFIDRWDAGKLNKILTVDTPAFSGISVSYTPAKDAVNLYRVTYNSIVPERGNKPIVATGLVAIPEGTTGPLPMVSYQHGTVYENTQVPSYPDQSPETQLMIAQFAAQGYVLIAADYFDPQFFAESAYGKLVAQAQSYRWVVKTPTRNFYGEADEAITVGIGRLPMVYQQAMGAGNAKVEAISAGQTSHRGTFAKSVPDFKIWFDEQVAAR